MPGGTGTLGLFPFRLPGAMVAHVEGPPIAIAQSLPELYRVVLERVASLEFLGHRHEAFLIRRTAIEVYSKTWDERALRRMAELQARAERVLDGAVRPRGVLPSRATPRPIPRPTARRSPTA